MLDKESIDAIIAIVLKQSRVDRLKAIAAEARDQGYIVSKMNSVVSAKYSSLEASSLLDIRYPSLVMLADAITRNKVPGALAEVGVYRGVFAKRIRALLPNRTFYLFDTFEGFDDNQAAEEVNKYGAAPGDFTNTSIDRALKTIGDNTQCIIKKGLFPSTAKDITDTFAFVSLDADLYEPIRDGLEFFYEKLNPGGYIMIHDCISKRYPGCGKAVLEFCKRRKIGYVPIADICMSAVITK